MSDWYAWARQRNVDDWPSIYHCVICGARLRYRPYGLCGVCYRQWGTEPKWVKYCQRESSNREYRQRRILDGQMQFWDDMQGVGYEEPGYERDEQNRLAPEDRALLEQAIASMTPLQAETVLLHFFENISKSKLAEVYGVSRQAIQGRIRRATRPRLL